MKFRSNYNGNVLSMTKESILSEVRAEMPKVLYVSGKTCTGKTTFSEEIERTLHYTHIMLDDIVQRSVVEPFHIQNIPDAYVTVYRDGEPKEQVDAFVSAAHEAILSARALSPVVVEGAIARPRVLREVFSGELADFLFVYFHPVHFDVYLDRIKSRFVAGAHDGTSALPKHFWSFVRDEDMQTYRRTRELNEGLMESLRAFAQASMEESQTRLDGFLSTFPDIRVVEV
jgi:hypothetical protein